MIQSSAVTGAGGVLSSADGEIVLGLKTSEVKGSDDSEEEKKQTKNKRLLNSL